MTATLERRIASALTTDTTSNDLLALITETERTITEADATAKTERIKALDPALSPDPKAARSAMEDAEFSAARLRIVLVRLQQRYQEVLAQEHRARWYKDYDALETKRDALATELAELYPEFVSKLTNLFNRIAVNDVELSHLHQARPSGVARHLIGAELKARGLEYFSITNPSVVQKLVLPDWHNSDQNAWPKVTPLNPVVIAPAVGGDPKQYSADWWQGREQRAEAHRAESGRVATFYEDQQRQREARAK